MSLISDALKKARQEAARQDALRHGTPYAVGAVDPPARNPWLPVLAGLGAGCVLAALVFLLAWMAGWGPFRRPAVEARTATAETAPAAAQPSPAPSPPSPVIEEGPPAPPVETAAPIPSVEPPPPAQVRPEPEERRPAAPPVEAPPPAPARPAIEITPAAPPPAATAPATQAPPAEESPAAPAPAPAASAPEGGLVDGKVYAVEVPVPGGGTLRLNGIAYSEDRPIAVLGGRVMSPGEIVQGFTLVEIQADRVKLQGHGATVYLSTK